MFATSCSQRACQAQATWLKPTGNPAGQQNSMARKDELPHLAASEPAQLLSNPQVTLPDS